MLAENSKEQRVRGRPFKKGVSGNPGGRPKKVGHIADLAREHTAGAIATIIQLMHKADRDSVRLRAAESILERAWGRSPSEVTPPGEPKETTSIETALSCLSVEELKALDQIKKKMENFMAAQAASEVL